MITSLLKRIVFLVSLFSMCIISASGFLSVDIGNWYRSLDNYFVFYVLTSIVLLTFLYFSNKIIKKYGNRLNFKLSIIIFVLLYFLISVLFVVKRNISVIDDQEVVLNFTFDALKGVYTNIFKGTYISAFPYQLGLAAYQNIVLKLYSLIDNNVIYNFNKCVRVLAILNCLLSTLSAYFGVLIVKELSGKKETAYFYMLMIIMFIPGIIYNNLIYNDIPSLSFLIISLYFFIQFNKKHKLISFVLTVIFVSMAFIVRMTAIIIAIAYSLILLFECIFEDKKISTGIMSLIIIILPLVFSKAPISYYEKVSNYYEFAGQYGDKLDEGCPYLANIAMGLDLQQKNYGWYSGYNFHTYVDVCNFSSSCAFDESRKSLKNTVDYMRDNPEKTIDFFIKKTISQWGDATNGSLFETGVQNYNREGAFSYLYNWGTINLVLSCYMKAYMILIYVFTLLELYRKRNVDRFKISDYMFEIIVTGGLLFSLIWEAKSRYIYPYFYIMIIIACITMNNIFSDNLSLEHRKHFLKK